MRPQPALINPLDPASEASPFRRSQPLTSPSARSSGAVTITFGAKVEAASENSSAITAQTLEAYLSYPINQTAISQAK